MKIYIFSIGV